MKTSITPVCFERLSMTETARMSNDRKIMSKSKAT